MEQKKKKTIPCYDYFHADLDYAQDLCVHICIFNLKRLDGNIFHSALAKRARLNQNFSFKDSFRLI